MAKGDKKTRWFQVFIIFLLALVVAISLGLVVFYFVQNDETVLFKESSLKVNTAEEFSVELIHQNPRKGTEISLDYNTDELECLNASTATTEWKFRVKTATGGISTITLQTNCENVTEAPVCEVEIGDGTIAHPYFVGNVNQLDRVNTYSSAYYRQIKDIEISQASYGNWTPLCVGGFSGNYDGQGHTIYGMTVNAQAGSNAGLFAKINPNGEVTKLIVKDATVQGQAANAGIIAGSCEGTISRVDILNSSVTSTSASANLGGVVGLMNYNDSPVRVDRVSVDKKSSVSFEGTAESFIGGIVGDNKSGTVINSFSRASVTAVGSNVYAGGIAGRLLGVVATIPTTRQKANIADSYATGLVSGSNGNIGGVVGNYDGQGRLDGVYYLDTAAVWAGNYATPNYTDTFVLVARISMDDARLQATYKSVNQEGTISNVPWNFTNVWNISSEINDGLPTTLMNGAQTADDIYDPVSPAGTGITTQAGLQEIKEDLGGTYEIGSDFDFDNPTEWTPIGTKSNPFTGILEGNGYTINFSGAKKSLFGYIGAGAEIRNLNIIGLAIDKTGGYVGGLAESNSGYVKDVTISGSVEAKSAEAVGGIVGVNNGTIQDSNADAMTISVKSQTIDMYVGGIAGINNGIVNTSNATNTSITSSEFSATPIYAGGIVGINTDGALVKNAKASNIQISLSKADERFIAGGIVGKNIDTAKVELSQVRILLGVGTANTTIRAYLVGGLVGINNGNTNDVLNITRSQVNSEVTLSGAKVGGLVGDMIHGTMDNCASFATLSADIMAGFAVTVQGQTESLSANGTYATIDRCFVSVTFEGNGEKYAETTSLIRATFNTIANITHVSNPDISKIAGYINNSVFNNKSGGKLSPHSEMTAGIPILDLIKLGSDYSGSSDEDCKKASTFGGFDITIWNIEDGAYPTIKF